MTARVKRIHRIWTKTLEPANHIPESEHTGQCKCDDDLLNVIFILCGNLFFRLFLFGSEEEEKEQMKTDRHRLIYIEIFSHIGFVRSFVNFQIEKQKRLSMKIENRHL